MPFGLTNSAASFQNLVNNIFQDLLDAYVVVYLDDIMLFSKSEEEHVTHVSIVPSRLRANNLFSKASKCLFHATSAEYLGYVVSSEGLKMDQENFQKILNWPPSRNLKALQSFLGFANFYRHVIKNYSKKISSLTSFLKKDSCFPLNEEALETDASNYASGAVLSQVSDSGKHPIAFDSQKPISEEPNYEIHDKELLGMVWALMCWRAFFLSLSHRSLFPSILHVFKSSYLPYSSGRSITSGKFLSSKGEDFISKNPMNVQHIIKQDEVQPSRYFAVKVKSFSNLIDSIQKALWQDSQYRGSLQESGKGNWTSWPREDSQTCQVRFPLVRHDSIHQGLCLILSTVLQKQEY
ncbi:hypothetical protein O181_114350 [Austropuccinia psidii MF-1]|uniref:Reverse transcriptase domain-containing protein n=1 Tax=Austropuccinia psidii MF-1 TaxID=1389203 RepID=A0A9Q3K499_9BASI|nr:hypothetical protein [Austropuccinia psidii MF-1]